MSTTKNTAQDLHPLRIFLASPGDVAEERKLAQEVLERLPYDPLLRGRITVETVAWDKPGAGAPLLANMTPQEAIAQGLPKPSECDIVIVILWSRIGTPLPSDWKKPDGSPYHSGTEWEYRNALDAAEQYGKPKLLLYRRTEKQLLDPSDPAFMEKYQQWRQVENFFAALRNPDGSIQGGCNEYVTLPQFKEDLTIHLRSLILELAPELRASMPGANLVQPPRPDLRAATAHYLSYLQDRYQYLSLKGIGLSERVPLQLPLLDLYIPLQARLELPAGETWDRSQFRLAGRALSTEEQKALIGSLSEPRPVLNLLQQRDGLVILGDPGAGKTTFLKYLVLQLAGGHGKALGLGERLPILAPLSGYANALKKADIRLDDFIAEYFHNIGGDLPLKSLLTEALEHGTALVLLDGLDEVQDDRLRHLVVERVVDFFTLRRKAGNKFVITSRIIGYRKVRPVATGLAECTLVDFDDNEITRFVERWTRALEKQAQGDTRLAQADAERERRELLEAVERNIGVRQLAANPLLLTILALMKRQGVTLPERRVELYEQYVKTLLSTWNRARGLGRPPTKDLDPVQTVKILAPLALWMHESNPGVGLVKREDIRRELEALYAHRGEADPEACTRQFLADVHDYASLLLERGPGEYGFIHLTFEEYLAAVAIALRHQGDATAMAQALGAHAGETAWHEIALLTVGYVGLVQQMDRIAGKVVETLCTESNGPPGATTVLAGEAVIDAWPAGVTPASKAKVITALVESFPNAVMPAEWRGRAGRALATLGDPRPGVGLREDGLPDLRWVNISGTERVRQSGRFPSFNGLKLGDSNTRLEISDFELALYPVTVAQFRPFIARGGYQEARYWSKTGWQWRDKEKQTRPVLWNDPAWGSANHPVIGVSWYEAEAYCTWLNEQSGLLRETIRLPTEAEWEWVARGPEGREYPWGNQWENGRCNSEESGIGQISAVGCFPRGAANWWLAIQPDSEVVHDVAGNVWEWTASEYREDYSTAHQSALNTNLQDDRPCVLRGGSWFGGPGWLRGAARNWIPPHGRGDHWGFRLARTFSL